MGMMSAEVYDALIDCGVTPEKAQKAAQAIAQTEHAATKSDLKELRGELRGEMSPLRAEVNQFRTEAKAEFSAVRGEMSQFRAEVKAEMAQMRTEFAGKFMLQGWMISAIFAVQIAIFIKMFIH